MASTEDWWSVTQLTAARFRRLYAKHQLLHIRGAASGSSGWWTRPMDELRRAFAEAPQTVHDTFTSESGHQRSVEELLSKPETAKRRRGESERQQDDERWYASFVVQGSRERLDPFLERAPLAELGECFARPSRQANDAIVHAAAVWVFFGQCGSTAPVPGRAEHTDAVEHDGTWHLQVAGSKVWYLRPTETLLASWRSNGGDGAAAAAASAKGVRVVVEAGDVLVVNTRLFWHRTEIPDTRAAADGLSVSLARDIFLGRAATDAGVGGGGSGGGSDDDDGATASHASTQLVNNFDGLYAADAIKEGTVVLTEDEMPECELPRVADNPSLGLASLPDGRMALVAVRDIAAGENFSLAPSDSEEDSEDDDDDDKIEEEEEGE